MTATPPKPPGQPAGPALRALMDSVAGLARRAAVFGEISTATSAAGPVLECAAAGSAAPAWYRLFLEGPGLWVALVTPDRWLSQSIEADLVHTGDNLEDLIEEELVDHGLEGVRLRMEHFRSEDKLFTFRSPIPVGASDPGAPAAAAKCLLAYEACFRNLGDMSAGPDD